MQWGCFSKYGKLAKIKSNALVFEKQKNGHRAQRVVFSSVIWTFWDILVTTKLVFNSFNLPIIKQIVKAFSKFLLPWQDSSVFS